MPRLVHARTLLDSVTIGINAVMEGLGLRGLTLRAIGREVRTSPATLLHHFDSLDDLLRVAAWETATDRLRDLETGREAARCAGLAGVAGFLPELPYEVVSARCWLGWQELARSHEGVAQAVADERSKERALIATAAGLDLYSDAPATLQALIDGLLVAMCAPEGPMPVDQARTLLDGSASQAAPNPQDPLVTRSAVARSASIIALGSAAE